MPASNVGSSASASPGGPSPQSPATALINWQAGWRELDLVIGLAVDATGGLSLLNPADFTTLPRVGVQLADVSVLGSDSGERIYTGVGSLVDGAGGGDELFNTDSQGGNTLVGGNGADSFFLRPVQDRIIGGQLFSGGGAFGLSPFIALADQERDTFLIDSSDPGSSGALQILDFEPGVDVLLVDGVAPGGDWALTRQQLQGLNVAINAVPQLSAEPITISVRPGEAQTLDLSAFANDADGDSLQLLKLTGPGWITTAGTTLVLAAPGDLSADQVAAADLELAFSDGQALATVRPVLSLAEPLPLLSITASKADRPEGNGGTTPFTFTISRSGDRSGVSTAQWTVSSSGRNAAGASDFAGNRLPSGTVRFQAGETSQAITVNVRGDLLQESDERFSVSLSQPRNATLGTGRVTATIGNDDLIGTPRANRIRGTAQPEYLDGRAGQDVLTGGPGPDLFGFRYRESPITTPDRITDFRFGDDRVAVLDPSGKPLPLPTSLSRSADNRTATSLNDLAAAVFADVDSQRRGNQALAANAAVLVRATNRPIAGTYLLINDKNASLNSRNDLMINITGYAGRLPGLGSVAVDAVFG